MYIALNGNMVVNSEQKWCRRKWFW